MAYDEHLAERIGNLLSRKGIVYEEKRMMGGLTFMVDDKMCVGVHKERMMARIDPEAESATLAKDGAEPMDFTGRRMRGFIFIHPEAIDMEDDLEFFINLALEYNPRAKSSKKKKK